MGIKAPYPRYPYPPKAPYDIYKSTCYLLTKSRDP